jgi:hypothetical protein
MPMVRRRTFCLSPPPRQNPIVVGALWLIGVDAHAKGIQNVFDLDPPFGAGTSENGYDESAFDVKERF